ncbi:MAG: hypothetical protein KAJ65_00170 [Gammaproteobacteria bacterium]|jgi:hypothetical protein|nr:hypothetical protein [Gammaproteobacteria bacterium]
MQTHNTGIQQGLTHGLAALMRCFDEVKQHNDMPDDHTHQHTCHCNDAIKPNALLTIQIAAKAPHMPQGTVANTSSRFSCRAMSNTGSRTRISAVQAACPLATNNPHSRPVSWAVIRPERRYSGM